MNEVLAEATIDLDGLRDVKQIRQPPAVSERSSEDNFRCSARGP